jgi:hypothetical protein
MYPVAIKDDSQFFFSERPQSWGWATWHRAWSNFNSNGAALLTQLSDSKSLDLFNSTGPHDYVKMLQNQIAGKNHSWYIRWYSSLLLKHKLTIMPHTSLIRNIGIDGSGTHCADWRFDPFAGQVSLVPIEVVYCPPVANPKIENQLARYYRKVKLLRYINFTYRLFNRWRKNV